MVESLGVRAIGSQVGKWMVGTFELLTKKYSNGEDIGYVGEIQKVNADICGIFWTKIFFRFVCPIGLDDSFHTYNINADDAACAIARAMNAEKLAFLTDIEGVYKDPNDPATLISELQISEAKEFIEKRLYRRRYAAEAQ